jgi:hypothetical protein
MVTLVTLTADTASKLFNDVMLTVRDRLFRLVSSEGEVDQTQNFYSTTLPTSRQTL